MKLGDYLNAINYSKDDLFADEEAAEIEKLRWLLHVDVQRLRPLGGGARLVTTRGL